MMDILYLDVSYVMVSTMSQSFVQVTSDRGWYYQAPKKTWSEMARRNCVLQVYLFFSPVKTHQEIKNDSKNTCREIQVDSMSLWRFLSLDTYPTQTKYFLGLFRGGFFVLNKDDFVILRRSCGSVQAPDAQDLFRSQRKAG